jgi:hypothetical protein
MPDPKTTLDTTLPSLLNVDTPRARTNTTGALALGGVELDQHIAFCLEAMKKNAEALGLVGSAQIT